MKEMLRHNRWFYLPYLLILITCVYFLIRFNKADIHLFLNGYHTSYFDIFFRYLTNLGDGICLPFFLLLMIWYRFRDGLYLVIVFLLSGFVVQFLKRFIFSDIARPAKFFGESAHIHFIHGVEQWCCNSFPSGHSATAFGFYLCFAIVSKRKWLKAVMLILACLVAYSRVYLSQHFLIDIVAGSFIGVIVATACYPWIYSLKSSWLDINLRTVIFKTPK